MAGTYRELKNLGTGILNGVLRLSDNAFIPADDSNTDFQSYKTWLATPGNTPDPDPNFSGDMIKNLKWEAIKSQRDSRKAGGVFVDSFWIHTDDSSRIQWIGLKDTARDNITAGGKMTDVIQMQNQNLMWKTLSGSFIQVTNQIAFDVVAATKNLDAILFAQAEVKRQAVNAMTDASGYDTTSGWNKTFLEANPS